MQPVKISIKGDYYDCQIYRGRLYLWTFDGALKVYKWNELVQSFIKKETDKIAMTFCFLDGNYLYKSSLIELFKDPDFKRILLKKFNKIEKLSLELTEKELEKFLFGEQDTPTGIIPTDTEIYSNKLYFIHEKGLYSGSAHRPKGDKFAVSSRPKKIWDCNLMSIKANKYPQLALSGGDEGLFELNLANSLPNNLKRVEKQNPIYQISKNHSSFSNYSYLNIYNTSLVEKSFLAQFKWSIEKGKNDREIPIRNFDSNINDKDIFEINNDKHFLSWGIEDKIYKARNGGFDIIKLNYYANLDKGEKKFTKLDSVNLHAWKGEVISGGTAYFGNIVECENALVVIQSNGENLTIPGPITRWRVYPRSMNYENHLHVILDDKIEIYSFNHDYFVNQFEKSIGIQFNQEKHRRIIKKSYFDDTDESLFDDGEDLPF
ncbi:hypothetical protein ACFFVK_04110 [Flavobacterium gyeonganense]|uniref:DKNYY family protein n=2 Tax=Flavobacterium gyeonganense TaxID=1310418 RepID=A0ABV5H799_9FLAO